MWIIIACVMSLLTLLGETGFAQPSFTAFESGPVRPLALSSTGERLFVVNTPDNRLEIFTLTSDDRLQHTSSVTVGLEPVAVAIQSPELVWVVNHLSDSVSIVDVGTSPPRVIRTLLVGDEPRDIVFAGVRQTQAFITTAHRGQHRTDRSLRHVPGAGDPQLTTPGLPRADVWVFDANNPGKTLGGTPLKIIELFGDTPRALAVSPDGTTVYAAVFHSGNQTAAVHEGLVCDFFTTQSCEGDGVRSPGGLPQGRLPGGLPGPATNVAGEYAPETSLIVQFDTASGEWRDGQGRNWSNGIRFFLPDHDVFAIDAETLEPQDDYEHVGTILFNMAVNPVSGLLYVSNTEARNLTRFEGPGRFGGSTVQGNLHQTRISIIHPAQGTVRPRHLNRHIDYAVRPAPAGTKQHSLATPLDMVVSPDGQRLYLAAFGSSKIGVFDTADLEDDALWDGAGQEFDPTVESAAYIPVSGGGPSGLALDDTRGRLYVATRFDNGLSVIDLATHTERTHTTFHNPEPASIRTGRPMLYDAVRSSANGEASCASCHVFGDFDSLAWDLGNPDEPNTRNPQPVNFESLIPFDEFGTHLILNGTGKIRDFASMKGPMTTQTLRGMAHHGHLHWRGDRANGFFGRDEPHTGDTRLSFRNFIVAFQGLLGLDTPPSDAQLQTDMEKFADFILQVVPPPNPIRRLDNTLTPAQRRGRQFFMGPRRSDGLASDFGSPEPLGFTCEGCHRLDPARGRFGTDGHASFEGEIQLIKTAHLRNMYQKVGMFGMPQRLGFNPLPSHHTGDQVRGFGILHDGATDTIFSFLQGDVFNPRDAVGFDKGNPQRRDVEQYMFAFESDLAPIVGQQVTLTPAVSPGPAHQRLALLEQRARTLFVSKMLGGQVTECDLIAKGSINGQERGYLYRPETDAYISDSWRESPLPPDRLRRLAGRPGQALTFTCVPPGSGYRLGLDRDDDGVRDRDERAWGFDPADADSAPSA